MQRREPDNMVFLLHNTYPYQKYNFKMDKAAFNHICCREDSKLLGRIQDLATISCLTLEEDLR